MFKHASRSANVLTQAKQISMSNFHTLEVVGWVDENLKYLIKRFKSYQMADI